MQKKKSKQFWLLQCFLTLEFDNRCRMLVFLLQHTWCSHCRSNHPGNHRFMQTGWKAGRIAAWAWSLKSFCSNFRNLWPNCWYNVKASNRSLLLQCSYMDRSDHLYCTAPSGFTSAVWIVRVHVLIMDLIILSPQLLPLLCLSYFLLLTFQIKNMNTVFGHIYVVARIFGGE